MRAFNLIYALLVTLFLASAHGSDLGEEASPVSARISAYQDAEPVVHYTPSTFLNIGAVLPERAYGGEIWEMDFPFHDLEGTARMMHFTFTFETVRPPRWHTRVTCQGARVERDGLPHQGDGVQFHTRFGIYGGFDPESCDNVPRQIRLTWQGGKEQILKFGMGGFTQLYRKWRSTYGHDGCGYRFFCVAPPPDNIKMAKGIVRAAMAQHNA